VRFVRADRDRPDACDDVARAAWDAVVDVSRQPGHVRTAAKALARRSTFFVLVSSVSVYRDKDVPGADERAPLLPPLQGDVMESMQSYGEAKVACERHVVDAFGADRSSIVRAGLIGGPGDASDRSGYWPFRFARPAAVNGAVLVPDVPGLMTQVIDVRDLADWILRAAVGKVAGVFNAVGSTTSMAEHLVIARRLANHRGPIVPVDAAWLMAHGVEPWAGPRSLPLWVPMPACAGFGSRDDGAAKAAGFSARPLAATLADVLAWELGRTAPATRRAGLTDADERALLDELASVRRAESA